LKRHLVLFLYTCTLITFLHLFFSSLHLVYFAPFIVLIFYRCPLKQALWWSFACGMMVDLFLADTRLGTTALNYCTVTFFLHNTQFHFFEDRQSTLPVMTFFYSSLSNLIQGMLLTATGEPFHSSWSWVQSDLLFIPVKTSLFSLLCYNFPLSAYYHLKRARRKA